MKNMLKKMALASGVLALAFMITVVSSPSLRATYNQYIVTKFNDVSVKNLLLTDSGLYDANAVLRLGLGATNTLTGTLSIQPSSTIGPIGVADVTVFTSTGVTVVGTTAVSTFTAVSTSAIVYGNGVSLAANSIVPGRTYILEMSGTYGTTGTPNLTMAVAFGTTTVATTGAFAASTATVTNLFWYEEVIITGVVAGGFPTGKVTAQGQFCLQVSPTVTITSGNIVCMPMLNTSTIGLDTTVANVVNPTATWGTASASNTIKTTNVVLYAHN